MKKIFPRVIVLIILGALLIALPVEIIGLVKNQNAFKTETEDKIEYAVKSAGTDLDIVFNSMESLINMMQSVVQVTFSNGEYIDNYDNFLQLKNQTGDIIRRSLENTEQLSGLYVTFSPSLHSGMEEVWYAYKDGEVTPIDARLYAPSWLVEGNPLVDYYYDAIGNGEYWGGPDYESSLDEYMITHTKSVYDKQGNLIGIVGSDMLISEVIDILNSIKIYNDSQIVLFDSDMGYCASSDDVENPDKFYSGLTKRISNVGEGSSVPIWYTSPDGEKHVAAYTTLNNGWVLAATQTVATVMTAANETKRTLIATMLLTIAIIIIIVIIFIKKFYDPVVELAEQNEIILINQSRQAKLGEMVGNIAHQCKQPLNSINIDISNMKDDYLDNELTEARFREYEEKMRKNVVLMSNTITDFADFLKPDRQKEKVHIRSSVEKALEIMKERLIINEIKIVNEVEPDIYIIGYRNELIQCIFNIIENARDAAVSSGSEEKIIKIYSTIPAENEGKRFCLNIFNTGETIPEGAVDKIFLPYYSTKEKEGGTGIGLYIVKQIIENHFGGRIYFINNENGVTFTIELEKGVE